MSFENNQRAFPDLTDSELQCLETIGSSRSFNAGDPLFQNGDRDYSFFAIRRGDVAILDNTSGVSRELGVHGNRAFTGDVSMLTGQPAVVSAVAKSACEVIEVPAAMIRQMLGELPEISDKLLQAFQYRRELLEESGFMGIRVIGQSDSKETLQLREFFYKNRVPHTFLDIDEDVGQQALSEFGATASETPVIACSGHVVKQPSLGKVAECLGISRKVDDRVYDVIIVGAGPAGLAAAVYGASEGLQTLLVDGMGPGGQAGQSSKIENYMGFPAGLPGAELANRGYLQALKFGAHFTAPVMVKTLKRRDDGNYDVHLCTGQIAQTRTVLIATGAAYRRLPISNCKDLEGAGVYYSATAVEARMCRNSTAIVVGGGNSAGQAAMYLSQHAKDVKILLRGDDLRKSMSDYLARRVEQRDNIEVCFHSEVEQLTGGTRLENVGIRNKQSDLLQPVDCSGLFIFVGAKPHTDWLPDSVALDARGFVQTGPGIQNCEKWKLDRPPCELETTSPGVFAAGDVRSGTTKRCAFAAGDGALAITCVHQYLSGQHA